MAVSKELGASRTVELSSGTIEYRERGEGPTLVFVHGLLVNGDLWRRVVARLAPTHRCITPDWPLGSHTTAMRPDADLSPPGLAATIAEFLDRLGLEDVTLVSNDTGTALAQLVLAEHPDRVGAAVLTTGDAFENFPPRPFGLVPKLTALPGVLRGLGLFASVHPTRRLSYATLSRKLDDPAVLRSFLDPMRGSAAIRRDLGKVLRGIHSRHTIRAADTLAQFEGDVLLAWSPEDLFFPLEDAYRLEALFPNAEVVEIPGALTYLAEDQPAVLAGAIRDFRPAKASAGTRRG